MTVTYLKIRGADAIRTLNEHRSGYRTTGKYPFLIGDEDEMELLQENAEFNTQDPAEIIRASLEIDVADWIENRRAQVTEDGIELDEIVGDWPGEISEKGSIGLHKDVLSEKIISEVYLGLATIDQPWHLPAVLKYGAWNECPEAEVQCAFHRAWQSEYGSEITGVSGDIIECTVANPPRTQENAIRLAWQQYWYCADIVDQGCESVSNLAATLMNSPYWYFWWD